MIRLKRAYEPAAAGDGKRVLVERLWPRGVTKPRLKLDAWHKDVAPSAAWRGQVTFVYAAHDEARNGAVALKAFLDRRL